MPQTANSPWPATREAGLERLRDFLPRAGRHYAESRNHDEGPGPRANVSALSPYIRHRLITEQEVVQAVTHRYHSGSAEKFLQEVCWRTYWKGWLELRPGVWSGYRRQVADLGRRLDSDADLRDRYEAVLAGRSGIACVDTWTSELIATGYLHNHARMWYASLWIFTLKLPWALGADLFFRNLLDADPASNTLCWRWVAGLQTKGKAYLAGASNIAKYTENRIQPTEPFSEVAEIPDDPPPPKPRNLPAPERVPSGTFALLLNEDDLDPASLGIEPGRVTSIAAYDCSDARSPLGPTGEPARAFTSGAIDDGLRRAASHFGAPTARLTDAESLAAWCRDRNVYQIVVPETPQGPALERLDAFRATLNGLKIRVTPFRRPWDDAFWPHATSGFFPFKEKIPEVLGRVGC